MYQTKSGKKNVGFYIALAICIVTIAAAAWTTYGSVVEYGGSSNVGVDNEVSGQPYDSSEVSEESDEPVSSEPTESSADTESSVSGEDIQSSPAEESKEDRSSENRQESSEPAEQSSSETKPTVYYPLKNAKVGKAYSMTKLLFSKTTNDWRTHRGADFITKEGSAVLAAADGQVKSVYHDALYGEVICIEHEGYTAKYCGLTEQPLVKEGDNVSGGSPIGYIGIVPCEQSDEPHLHLEIMIGDKYVDPIVVLSGNANLNE